MGNCSAALNKLTPLATAGDTKAEFVLGLIMYGDADVQNYAEALKWFRLAVKKEYAPAQYFLADMYHYGNGIAQDKVEADKLYRLAADAGIDYAQFYMGAVHRDGIGVPRDYAKSTEWFSRAAEDWLVDAQYEMGVIYETGRGVTKDGDSAYMWFFLARLQWHIKASEKCELYEEKMSQTQIAKLQAMAKDMGQKQQEKMAEKYTNPTNPYATPN